DKTSRAAERTTRVKDAARASPRATAGKIRDIKALPGLWDHGVKPPAGSQRKFTANTRIRKIPSQKDGVAMPIWAKAVAKRSAALPRRRAAKSPKGTPTAMANASAMAVRGSVTRSRSAIKLQTGTPYTSDVPRSNRSKSDNHRA